MNRKIFLLAVVTFLFLQPLALMGASGREALQTTARQVAALGLGFGDYVLGEVLTADQKAFAQKNRVEDALQGTYKFGDGDIVVVVSDKDDIILALYKDNPAATRAQMKEMVGELMMRFSEPTTMAHDTIIYWAYNQNGKISEDEYDFSKQSGETEMIATVKLQSSMPITPDEQPTDSGGDKTGAEKDAVFPGEKAGIYVIISSNPMSRLFLALNK
ncbi:hypothetical protein SAMN05660330_03081 [Desulforhopalus singaporensis]|uniref:Uncharacterized protein n=2 Tax=Desulforhopalus singaporensis TaxID=91360 RepID=A0A1H0TGG5_9BACT|nr:hypothetical protein SAMN05660330_03081 [Desulforhopalus singaporensis]